MAATVAAPTQLYATAAETLVQSLPYDPMNAEQSHFSEAELAAADAARRRHQVAGGGRGRKDDHMSAWLMDEDGQMLSDYEDEEEDEENEDSEEEDEEEDKDSADDMDGSDDDDDGEAVDSSAADDAAAAAEWRRVRQAATEDRDYPDEVDVPIDVSARQRFARFRGLKSLRTSPWDPKEQLPPDYSRIFKLANAQQSAAVAKRRAEADCFE
jgi:pre-rRNA-processing protein TSR1